MSCEDGLDVEGKVAEIEQRSIDPGERAEGVPRLLEGVGKRGNEARGLAAVGTLSRDALHHRIASVLEIDLGAHRSERGERREPRGGEREQCGQGGMAALKARALD